MDKNLKSALKKPEIPQTKKLPGRKKEMKKNNAGGAVFKITKAEQLSRFLIIGASSGLFYANSANVSFENAKVLEKFLKKSPSNIIIDFVDEIAHVSHEGLAVSNEYALYALAMVGSPKYNKDTPSRSYALKNVGEVVRTFPHLTSFLSYSKALGRGWGHAYQNAIGNWYSNKTVDSLAYQMVKYRQRDGWIHKDALRLASPKADSPAMESLFRWGVGASTKAREVDRNGVVKKYPAVPDELPRIVEGYEKAKKLTSAAALTECVREYGLTHEMLPKEALAYKSVWEALSEKMPLAATLWNLGRFSSLELLKPFSDMETLVIEKISNEDYLKKSRIHPINVLKTLKFYKAGKGQKGSLRWTPNDNVLAALDDAFYKSFKNIKPTNKKILVALDVSVSMGWGSTNFGMTAAEISTAMAMATVRTEKQCHIKGFATTFKDLEITRRDSLQEAMRKTIKQSFGGTDCALPMLWAQKNRLDIDAFVIYTDNETWYGNIHPSVALKNYRKFSGNDAKLIVCATSATQFSIADPQDSGMLDIAGFSAATPSVISSVISGEM